jgi:predicted glycoside hydrolase/deacetylase ChbG (UPF0249 family)
MNKSTNSQTNQLLGYPADARLLIINADDFGMCNSVNQAIIGVLEAGVVRSASLMVVPPWANQAINYLRDHPEIPFGVHLTMISEWEAYRWGPLTCKDKVLNLVDQWGNFYKMDDFPESLDETTLEQLEVEFRAQIEAVFGAGLKPTHLDWHVIRIEGRENIFDIMLRLAREHGLALRVRSRPFIQRVRSLGLLCNDYDFVDSYGLHPVNKGILYAQMLRELPPGLSEWAIHPGLDNPELLAMEPEGKHIRQTDYDFWTSQRAKELIKEEGIILIDYRVLQAFWREK